MMRRPHLGHHSAATGLAFLTLTLTFTLTLIAAVVLHINGRALAQGAPPWGQPQAPGGYAPAPGYAPQGRPVQAPMPPAGGAQQPHVQVAPAVTQQPPVTPAAPQPLQQPQKPPRQAQPPQQAQPAKPANTLMPERVEADVSTRSVAVTSSFTGTEIVIFGSVENSRQPTAESGLYDIAIIVEGTETPVIARKKSNVAGLWINTQSARFEAVPSYYTIISTRPIEEITEVGTLHANGIGFDHVPMKLAAEGPQMSPDELAEFKRAVVRRKQADNLFQKKDYGVVFIGRSLFRSTISLPANVPVGPLTAQVFLFKDGKLLSSHQSRVTLQREGIERFLHNFAFDYPLFYGIFAVLVAVAAGMIASALFKKGSH